MDDADALRDVKDRVRRLLRAFRRGRLTPARVVKVRTILDEAVAKLEALVDEQRRSLGA